MSSLSLTILLQSSPCHAFSARLPNKAWIRRRTWIWSNDDDNNNSNNNNNNYDDFGDNDSIDNENNNNTEDDNVNDNDSDNEIINNNDDNASDSGQALAREFYKQLRLREQNAAAAKNYNDIDSFTDKYPSDSIGPKDTLSKRRSAESYPKSNNNNNQNESQEIFDTLSEQQKRELNSKPFSNRREVSAGKDVYSKNKKFTGRSSSMINNNNNPTSSAGLFSGSGQSLFAEPPSQSQQPSQQQQSPRQRMMQTEFNLATRAERSIGIQAVFALILLVFYLAVGLTGGIQNNTLYWENATDQASLDELQQLIPEPTDIEKSVWL